jgi:microcystin-dependent protein
LHQLQGEATTASTFTPALGLEIPAHGDYASTGWDNPMDNSLRQLDTAYGGLLSLAVTTGNVVLTTAQASNPIIVVSGTLSGNVVICFPPTVSGRRIILPACTMGNFALFVRANNGADQTGVYFWTGFGIPYGIVVTPSRVYWDYGGSDIGNIVDKPNGFAGNGWLPCDGRFVGMLQHDLLWDIIGGTYGVSGSYPTGAFKLPDFRGTVTAMADQIGTVPPAGPFAVNTGNRGILNSWGMNTFAGEAAHQLSIAEMPGHDHGFAQSPHNHPDPGHAHPGVIVDGGSGWYKVGVPGPQESDGNTGVSGSGLLAANANISFTAQGGWAPHNNIQPTTTTMKMIKW